MSEEQIRQIIQRLDKQDAATAKDRADNEQYRVEREKIDNERLDAHYKVWQDLRATNINLTSRIEGVKDQVVDLHSEIVPMLDLFKSVRGFDRIAVWILKFLLGVGALITAIGVIIVAFRKIINP